MLASMLLFALLFSPTQAKPGTPITPGHILLRAASSDVAVRQEVVQALRVSDPLVRATAARVLITYGVPAYTVQLREALNAETDPLAAAEMIRALLVLGKHDSTQVLEGAANRAGGRAVVVLAEWYVRNNHDRLADWLPSVLDRLTPAESLMISRLLQTIVHEERGLGIARAWTALLEQRAITQSGALGGRTIAGTDLRVITSWAPGLLDSVIKAAGCKISDKPRFGFARISFGPQGRLSSVEIDRSDLSNQCKDALTALVLSEVQDAEEPLVSGERQWVMVPFGREFLACSNHPDDEALRMGESGIVAPRKIKDKRPDFPASALQQRRGGVVVVESLISSRGCVKGLRVLKSAGLDLDVAGLLAITQWQFEPARRGGQPIPVRMTVTVNFTIQ